MHPQNKNVVSPFWRRRTTSTKNGMTSLCTDHEKTHPPRRTPKCPFLHSRAATGTAPPMSEETSPALPGQLGHGVSTSVSYSNHSRKVIQYIQSQSKFQPCLVTQAGESSHSLQEQYWQGLKCVPQAPTVFSSSCNRGCPDRDRQKMAKDHWDHFGKSNPWV